MVCEWLTLHLKNALYLSASNAWLNMSGGSEILTIKKTRKRVVRSDKIDPYVLTARDLRIFRCRKINKMTIKRTSEELGHSVDIIKHTQNKPAYNELCINALEMNEYTINAYAQDLIGMTKAVKNTIIGGSRIEEPDNAARMQALNSIARTYGADAPKEINMSHQFTQASEEEILSELSSACDRLGVIDIETGLTTGDELQQLSGDLPEDNSTQTPSGSTVESNAEALEEPRVDEDSSESEDVSRDTGP